MVSCIRKRGTYEKKQLSSFKYYYKELLSHYGIAPQNKKAKKFLIHISILDIILLILCILFVIFKNSTFIHYFTNGSQTMYLFYVVMLIYTFIAAVSFTLYHIISYFYEFKYKHELLKKDIKGVYVALFLLYELIHLPWILFTCLILKILELFKIPNLRNYLPMLTCGYLYFLIIALAMIQVLCKYLDKLLCNYTFLTNDWVTESTYLYIIVFFSIVISKHIPTGLLEIVIHPFVNKNSTEYKRIFNQYHLLNYYFLVAITLVLKALNFTGEEKTLIDALFYTTNALTLFSTARQKASSSS